MRARIPTSELLITSVVLAVVLVANVAAQIPFQPGWKYRSGQNVVPAFEGWQRNPDGTIDMLFGYFNRNYEELIDIPTGPNNNIEPGGPDQGQPTFFLPSRHRFFFAIRVPKDWPATRKLVWTLTVRGRTEKATAFLLPEWEVDTSTIQGSLTAAMDPLNKPPAITVGPDRQNQTITLPGTATLSVSATDDGRPARRGGGPGGGRGPAATAEARGRQAGGPAERGGAGSSPDAASVPVGLRVEWLQYRGPVGGRIAFAPPTTPIVDGKASTEASFSLPGRYVVRAFANDGAVTTPADLTVIVNPRP